VDRPDKQTVEAVQGPESHAVLDAVGDPVLQLLCRPLGEGECNDRLRCRAIGEQVRDALGNDLGLAGARTGNDLEVAAAVADSCQSIAFELRGWGASLILDHLSQGTEERRS
jgi:hypothetical protein